VSVTVCKIEEGIEVVVQERPPVASLQTRTISEHLNKYLCSTLPAAVFNYITKKDIEYNGHWCVCPRTLEMEIFVDKCTYLLYDSFEQMFL